MSQKKIALIGANSFLAQALYQKIKGEYKVFQVYHIHNENIASEENCYPIDAFLNSNENIDYIFFFTAIINYEESEAAIEKIFQTNVLLLKKVMLKFASAKIIHSSSVSIYKNTGEILTENSSNAPTSSYAMSKLWAEQLLENHSSGAISIRISSLFGTGMKTQTFISNCIIQAITTKEIIIFGDGSRMQNYISASEAADYFYLAMQSSEDKLLAVGENSYTNIEIALLIQSYIPGTQVTFRGVDTSQRFRYDNSFSKEKLNYKAHFDFKEELYKTIQWIQKQY